MQTERFESLPHLSIWEKLAKPPKTALRQITGGRLRGKTDINPQWRYKAMTEQFGPCGIGWWYTIDKQWLEPAPDGQQFAFVNVTLYVKESAGIPGTGGSMLIEKESGGLHANDEAYKMATTDALSVAMKMLGVAADVYAGLWDGAKYAAEPEQPAAATQSEKPRQVSDPTAPATTPQMNAIFALLTKANILDDYKRHEKVTQILGLNEVMTTLKNLTRGQASLVIEALGKEVK